MRYQIFSVYHNVAQKIIGCFGGLVVAFGAYSASLTDSSNHADKLTIYSSTIWQKNSAGVKVVYPAGTPLILSHELRDQIFTIEQYFNQPLKEEQIKLFCQGNCGVADGLVSILDSKTTRHGIFVRQKKCSVLNTAIEQSKYRCIVKFSVDPSLEAGNLGLTVGYYINSDSSQEIASDAQANTFPIESTFTVIIPEYDNFGTFVDSELVAEEGTSTTPNPSVKDIELNNVQKEALSLANRSVVQVMLNEHVALGSGFVLADVKQVSKLFNNTSDRASLSSDGRTKYVLTAAHLFPQLYLPFGDRTNFKVGSGELMSQQNYQVKFAWMLTESGINARLMRINLEVDLALLEIDSDAVVDGTSILGDVSVGLDIADHLTPADRQLYVIGFPSIFGGRIYDLFGEVVSRATQETANIGQLNKIKLVRSDENILAYPGMSGGPIISLDGLVVGIAVEKPNEGNGLIALDITEAQFLNRSTISYDNRNSNCTMQFNPYERTLSINNNAGHCPILSNSQKPLNGNWMLQEILGPASDLMRTYHTAIAGQSIIHGHVIIFEPVIVDGEVVLNPGHEGCRFDLQSDTFNVSSNCQLARGFALDPASFKSITVKGVKVLDAPAGQSDSAIYDISDNRLVIAGTQIPTTVVGKLALGVKDHPSDPIYREIQSARDFALWLGVHQSDEDVAKNICFAPTPCKMKH